MEKTLTEIIFILLFFILIELFIFIKNRKARILLFNLIPVFIITISYFNRYHHIDNLYLNIISFGAIFSYPYTFSLLAMEYYPVNKKSATIKTVLLTVPIIILLIFTHWTYPLICLFHFIIYIRTMILIKNNLFIKYYILFIMIIPFICLFYYCIYQDAEKIINFYIVLTFIITLLFVLLDYSKKLQIFNLRMIAINSLNRRLNQIITRLRQSNEQLKKIIAQKDIELFQIARHASLAEVATGIAHELAQPLTGIKCLSQNMVDDINSGELDNNQALADLLKISSLVDRSSSIIDHIRTFSRKRVLYFQHADLNACILNAIELINNQIRNNCIDLVFKLDETIPPIRGDNLSLEQLFINLILNSRDAIVTKKENSPGHNGIILITTGFINGFVTLVIKDNGYGIPDNIIPQIWTPFFTTKRKGKGTGIGLSLCHRIIRDHNADVLINSSCEGTIFTINFPSETEFDNYE